MLATSTIIVMALPTAHLTQIMFQVEMAEIRSIVSGATKRSLVLVDEICRGTETAKGTCIAGSIVETLDAIGCLGIISTHLHGIFSLPLNTKNTVHKAMGTVYVDGQPKPTWKLMDGICRESLAFETAKREGIPESIIERAEGLYQSVYANEVIGGKIDTKLEEFCSTGFNNFDMSRAQSSSGRVEAVDGTGSVNNMEVLQEVESAITLICQKMLVELDNEKASGLADIQCIPIHVREQPPPSTVGASCVYVIFRADRKLYVGQVNFVGLNSVQFRTQNIFSKFSIRLLFTR